MDLRTTRNVLSALASVGLAAVSFSSPCAAQDFYDGKTISMMVGTSAGGGYDTHARFVIRHIERHIPGSPKIIARNMPGAGGMAMLNHVYNVAPQDGTVLFTMHDNLPMSQRLGVSGVQYDARRLQGVGRLSAGNELIMAHPRAGVSSYKDLYDRELVVGGTSGGTNTVVFPILARNILGLKFKMTAGYQGNSAVKLAMERGEVNGMTMGLASMYGSAPEFLKPGAIVPLIQFGSERAAEWPDAPAVHEIAKTDEDRQALEAVSLGMDIGRSYWFGPEVPREQVQTLRAAFEAMIKDERTTGEAKKRNILIRFASGEQLEKFVERVLLTPDAAVNRLKDATPTR